MRWRITGVDPGLVHTGCVDIYFDMSHNAVHIRHEAVAGPDAAAVGDFAWRMSRPGEISNQVFIEGYRPRSHFDTDSRMTQAVRDIHAGVPGSKVLQNTGVTKVVKQPLMEMLGVWNFSTTTHHQDLRSAARIALLGAMKDPTMNTWLADAVLGLRQRGGPWRVYTQ